MKPKKTVLKNGLRVITVPMKDNPTVTVLVMVEAGSKYENKDNNGISHFLEHMAFKGTKKRPHPKQISFELEGFGSSHNAFTSQEYTGYYAKANKKHLPKLFDLVSDMYLNPIFDEEEIRKESGVIIEEINMYEDLPQYKVWDIFMKLLYGDQPAGMDILGPKKNLQQFGQKDFVEYRTDNYVPQSTTIVIAGDVPQQKVVSMAKKAFDKMPKGKKATKKKVKDVQTRPVVSLHYKKTDQAHLLLGFRADDVHSKKLRKTAVLNAVFGMGLGSRLTYKLRDELGMSYYASSELDLYTDHGYIVARAGVTVKRIEEAVSVILGEFAKLCYEDITEEELKRAQEVLVGATFRSLETSDGAAQKYGMREILGLTLKTAEEQAREIRSVTVKDVRTEAKRLFKNKNLNLALVGPFKDKKQFEKILKL
jgi:predicted Zn-dependent peptidase